MLITQRLQALRAKMKQEGVAAYIMPLSDPHQSEYPATYWKSLAYISGFTGSAGTVMVSQDHAGLWTDSRYFIQGEQELEGSSFELHKMNVQHHPGYIEWLQSNLKKGDIVIADGPMISLAQKDKWSKKLSEAGIKLKTTADFIDSTWENRPQLPDTAIFEHEISYAGQSRAEKLAEVRKGMAEKEADYHLVTTLDDIAWILNLRGSDVECNPVFVSFLLIAKDKTQLFINEAKVPSALKEKLLKDGITIQAYNDISSYLSKLQQSDRVLINNGSINVQLHEALSDATTINGKIISRHLKAIKNTTEIDHFRRVHVKDAVALTHAFYWLEQTVKERTVTEYEFAAKIGECRSQQQGYFGESFSAIVGYKGNGAIIHYRPALETAAEITYDGILLVDSGGQYIDGTTDITRTITFSPPPAEQKNAYTRVLKGHIALAKAVFPEGTTGGQLDTLARHSLWEDGLNYGHGTGHGVGFFLNVHEPPQGFAPGATGRATSSQKPGMVTSNEPGHYVTDKYGIRIENLILTKQSKTEGFLEFETITYFPIDTQLIDFSLLTKGEVDWLNAYHEEVKTKVCPQLDGVYKAWMEEKCKPV